ncbi:MAG: hypothetical protein K0B37_14055 [Bacteroidales bacterium]|nr:hypothetical protein [Bacteroidales bacterium]
MEVTISNNKSLAFQTDKGGLSTRRDYAGPFVFVNNAPGWFSTPHGRFVYIVDGWQNEFHLRDHLGNTRRVVMEEDTGTLATLQQNHYYPFGMLIPSLSTSNTIGALKDNRYLYIGKLERSGNPDPSGEFNDDFELNWYVYPVFIGNYGVKFYDAQIGRWHSVDPHAENYTPVSPYAYVGNNPIVRIDPDGRDWYEDKEGNILFDQNLSKDNHETYMQENGIEGKYWGTTGFSINEESGLSIAYFSDGTSKEGLWQLNEVVVEAEMGESARTRMNAESLGIYDAQNTFLRGSLEVSIDVIGASGELLKGAGYLVSASGVGSGIGLGLLTLGGALTTTAGVGRAGLLFTEGNYNGAYYEIGSSAVGYYGSFKIGKSLNPEGVKAILNFWIDLTKTPIDKTAGSVIK